MAKRTKTRRKYQVNAELSNFQLAKVKSALTLRIYARGEKVGELEVGRGSLVWRGKDRQRFKRVSWGRFTDLMNDLAYGRRR